MQHQIFLLSCLAGLASSAAFDSWWPSKCQDLSTATLPTLAESPLAGPDNDLVVYHVAIGRGTQNYTCTSEGVAPTARGALADLYDVSCIAASSAEDLAALPGPAATDIPFPATHNFVRVGPKQTKLGLSGHHYFPDFSTPTFNLNTAHRQLGINFNRRLDGRPAPPAALPNPKDQSPPIQWLQLQTQTDNGEENIGNVRQVYRVETVGGGAPMTCDMVGDFQRHYVAEYWFFSTPPSDPRRPT